ncbi:MAG: hypothetical protein A6F72_00170 [Cycloclasticus sp. symbiont of Poecilosclerida sp. N]|nr:MAG: hypothetical protein A6F72_00170 [Cycloclasticus sp. symbiont of Poecilosclerida sp. N]
MQKSFSTQSNLFFSTADLDHPILHSLDDTEALLEWSEIETLLTSIYDSNTGRPCYPLLTLFRSLLLGVWYQLSDVQLAQCLYRDLLFRKFCRLELGGDVPEASTIGRFRTQLVEHGLWGRLLGDERPFATYKRHYGLARTRFMGLGKNTTVYGLAAMAANFRKGAEFLTLYGIPEPSYAG